MHATTLLHTSGNPNEGIHCNSKQEAIQSSVINQAGEGQGSY